MPCVNSVTERKTATLQEHRALEPKTGGGGCALKGEFARNRKEGRSS